LAGRNGLAEHLETRITTKTYRPEDENEFDDEDEHEHGSARQGVQPSLCKWV